jgi:RNA polymerase sigma-70 factor (ECF subfamily)
MPAETTPGAASELQSAFVSMMDASERRLNKIAWMYCRRKDDQEELMQEIVCKLWIAFPSFRGESKESTWVHAVAHQTARMYLRSQRKWIGVIDEFPEEIHPGTTEDEKASDIETSLQNLRDNDKVLLVMLMEGYSYSEISKALGVSINTLYQRVHCLRELLKGKMTF